MAGFWITRYPSQSSWPGTLRRRETASCYYSQLPSRHPHPGCWKGKAHAWLFVSKTLPPRVSSLHHPTPRKRCVDTQSPLQTLSSCSRATTSAPWTKLQRCCAVPTPLAHLHIRYWNPHPLLAGPALLWSTCATGPFPLRGCHRLIFCDCRGPAAQSWSRVSFGEASSVFKHVVMAGTFGFFLTQFLEPLGSPIPHSRF